MASAVEMSVSTVVTVLVMAMVWTVVEAEVVYEVTVVVGTT